MRIKKIDFIHSIFLTLAAVFLVFDLFLVKGLPTTFDGRVHVTNIAQYYQALKDGEFPVRWANGIANYGVPTPILSQQTTNYLGAIITDVTHNPLLSFKLLFLIGSVLGSVLLYWFLRVHTDPLPALLGAFLFTFTPYRIFDMYIRGDLPEFFAIAFIPLLLLGIFFTVTRKNMLSFLLLTLSTALLVCTHPFVFFIGMFVAVPYTVMLLLQNKSRWQSVVRIGSAFILGLGLSTWYIVPLVYEVKYFYIGAGTHLIPNQYLSLVNYVTANWSYGTSFIRENFIQVGILGTFILILGAGVLLAHIKEVRNNLFLACMVVAAAVIVFLTTPFSQKIYELIPFLGNIQFPWRMLIALDIVIPILLALLTSMITRYRYTMYFVLLVFIALLQFPGLYGKNYIQFNQQHYFFTQDNTYSISGNPIWSEDPLSYRIKQQQAGIIDGSGRIVSQKIVNSRRLYTVSAQTPIQMIDYTFYFPGWKVLVDGVPTQIQYQDPNHRGLITYPVPAGNHNVVLTFGTTKDRILGDAVTGLSALATLLLVAITVMRNKLIKNAVPIAKVNKKGKRTS